MLAAAAAQSDEVALPEPIGRANLAQMHASTARNGASQWSATDGSAVKRTSA